MNAPATAPATADSTITQISEMSAEKNTKDTRTGSLFSTTKISSRLTTSTSAARQGELADLALVEPVAARWGPSGGRRSGRWSATAGPRGR